MGKGNHSGMSDFILLGFEEPPEHSIILFVCFLTMYLITLVANSTMILIISVDGQLQTPMYFFLRILSFVDICLTTCTIPKLLVNIFAKRKTISFYGCFLQIHFFISFGIMKDFLLAIMAVDRYLAISRPLHYVLLMNRRVCVALIAGSWIIVSGHAALNSVLTSQLSYCGSNEVHHYFCELTQLFKASCSNTFMNEFLFVSEWPLFLFGPLLVIIISYILIIITVVGMHSREGGRKAFSTCSSHLFVVTITYVPLLYTYIRPSSVDFIMKDLIMSVMFTIGCSMLNPFVYSIRNKDVKKALIKALNKRTFSLKK
ncbi:olfactory receptor 1L1-like [Ambystoma mexicanum]|uniref:olfactory receptor 1L1-like n=1 Tax=Ambystoma mexicanum TaxID=8296 RepID=UPI0037E7C0CE